MNSRQSIVVIGGGACGPKAAARARRMDPHAKITIVQDEALISYAACGLPYYIAGSVESLEYLFVRDADSFKSGSNIEVLVNSRVEKINRNDHTIEITNSQTGQKQSMAYDKLVFATGAYPVVPQVEGIRLRGINVLKRVPDANQISQIIRESQNKKAVIIGAGLIGIEMAEALVARGLSVTVVEALNKVLPGLLDDDIACLLANHLKSKGVALKLQQQLVRFEGVDGNLKYAVTNQENIEADVALIAIGVRPNTALAAEAGLIIGRLGEIDVNQYLQTSDPDIYAGGDCIANIDLVTGNKVFVPMGSTANKHGRVIGTNVVGGKEEFHGVVGTACLKAFDYNVGRTGLGEEQAKKAGFTVTTALLPGLDKPNYYPGAGEVVMKLVVDSKTRRILGAQGIGPGDVIKRIDVLATAISNKMSVDHVADLDLSYAPPYNSALDVVHHAANLIRNKIDGIARSIKPQHVNDRLMEDDDFLLLDVRSKPEWDNSRMDAQRCQLFPQECVYAQMHELPRNKEIIVMCKRGSRAYQVSRVLQGEGFRDVKFMEGSLMCWCGRVIGESLI